MLARSLGSLMESCWSIITPKMSEKKTLLNYVMTWSLMRVHRQPWLHWLSFNHTKKRKKERKEHSSWGSLWSWSVPSFSSYFSFLWPITSYNTFTSCSAMRMQNYNFQTRRLYTWPNWDMRKSQGGIFTMQKFVVNKKLPHHCFPRFWVSN